MSGTESPPVSARCQRVPLPESHAHFPGQPYSVSVLKVGYCVPQDDGTFRADGTISLITGPRTVLVDTGGPWDRDFLLQSLEERGLEPGDISLVVGTHGHSDHIGNLGLFPAAVTIVGHDISEGDRYRPNRLAQGHAYTVDEHITVVPCPGHTGQDVSVQVKGTSAGTVLVAGDLFESCSDEDSWRDLSMNTEVQEVSRQEATAAQTKLVDSTKIYRMIATSVLIFLISFLPYHASLVVLCLRGGTPSALTASGYSLMLACLNTVLDPVAYYFTTDTFRSKVDLSAVQRMFPMNSQSWEANSRHRGPTNS